MLRAGYGNITIKTERGEIMNDKKKILAAAGILVLVGAAATAFYIGKKNKTQMMSSVCVIGGADGPREPKPQFWILRLQKNSPMDRLWNSTM